MTSAELAGGFGLPGALPLSGRIEESFRRRLDALPAATRRLLRLAAADPVGEPSLLWRAAERLAIGTEAATPAVEAGLIEFDARVRFRHPLVRSAAYSSASLQERQDVHRALAEVTDHEVDPDRRAWHRAQATPGPDEDVASELERSAGRAQARGGVAAAAAFLERSAMLTRELLAVRSACSRLPGRRATPVRSTRHSGCWSRWRPARLTRCGSPRWSICADRSRWCSDALPTVLGCSSARPDASSRSTPTWARETHFEALGAAMWVGGLDNFGGVREAAEAARAAPPGPEPPRAVDVLLDAFAMRFTDGYAPAAPTLTRALELVLALNVATDEVGRWLWLAGSSSFVALELWDAESSHALAARVAQVARDTGALVLLQFALDFLAWTHLLAGELSTAALMIEEDRLIAEVTGNPPVAYSGMMFAAWRGQEPQASDLSEAALQEATAGGLGRMVDFANCASSVLDNGFGRHDAARDAAWRVFEHDQLGFGPFVVPELAEAASRTGDTALVTAALEWLSERTRVTPTEWALGIEARVRAMLSEGDAADSLYRESIARLGRTRVRVELARAHLLYGEWLRRERRRGDAREQLRAAHDMLDAMGIEAFAERARRELRATGETVRKRTVETRDELTAQERQIARLARDGLSNPEIGIRLFISPRTVKYHLRKVFTKLDISSRNELNHVLPDDPTTARPL